MKNEFHAEQQKTKQAYNQPVLVDLGELKHQTLGDGDPDSNGDLASQGA